MSNHSSALPTVAAAIWRAPLAGLGGTSGSKVAVPDKKAPESGDAQQCGEVAGAYLSRNIRARKNVRPLWVAEVSTTPYGCPTYAGANVGHPYGVVESVRGLRGRPAVSHISRKTSEMPRFFLPS